MNHIKKPEWWKGDWPPDVDKLSEDAFEGDRPNWWNGPWPPWEGEIVKPKLEYYGLNEERIVQIENAVSDIDSHINQLKEKEEKMQDKPNSFIVGLSYFVAVFIIFKYFYSDGPLVAGIFLSLCLATAAMFPVAILLVSVFFPPMAKYYQRRVREYDSRKSLMPGYGELEDYRSAFQTYTKAIMKMKREWNEMVKWEVEEQKRLHELREREYWQKLDGFEFEKSIADLFRRLGHKVEETPGSGDLGVDLFVDENIVVQCKATETKTSPSVVRDLFGTMKHFRKQKGIVVSIGGFTVGCCKFSRDKNIDLWDLEKILEIARKLGIYNE